MSKQEIVPTFMITVDLFWNTYISLNIFSDQKLEQILGPRNMHHITEYVKIIFTYVIYMSIVNGKDNHLLHLSTQYSIKIENCLKSGLATSLFSAIQYIIHAVKHT